MIPYSNSPELAKMGRGKSATDRPSGWSSTSSTPLPAPLRQAVPEIPYANIARTQARRFYWPGATREDVEQEAMLALIRHRPQTPGRAKTIVRRHLIEQVRRETRRRPQFVELLEAESPENIFDITEARERLRAVLSAPLSDLERVALGRTIRGEGCSEKALDNALQRARKKLAA